MHTWKAYFAVNGSDFSRFPVVSFPVEDVLYAQIQNAVKEGLPFRSCAFFEDLVCLAVSSLDLSALAPDWLEDEEISDYVNGLNIVSCTIDDPGDMKRLENRIRGLRLPSGDYSCEDECCTRRYCVHVSLDDAGCITEVVDVQAEGLVSESANSSSWESCYPDYNLIAGEIEKECSHD